MTAKHARPASDSGAFSHLGQNVEVPGLVFALLIRQLGTALIIIVQDSLTSVVRKTFWLFMAALSLIWTASHSQAALGWTLAQLKQQYGQPVLDQAQVAGRTGYVFTGEDYIIAAFFRNTQVSRILYISRGGSVFDWGRANALLRVNAPDAIWHDASKNEADNSYRVNGTKDDVESYYASLTDDGKMLAIWTKEDDEAGRTNPTLDPPSVSSVVDSNQKSTGELTAGHGPSDSGLPPEKKDPEVPENATSTSPAPRPTSAHAFRPKIAKVKLRSSVPRGGISHVANFNAKARATPFSPQHIESQPSGPPPLMNAGTGLYHSDYTQPYKNLKKTPGP
jgi:hypothetical protein